MSDNKLSAAHQEAQDSVVLEEEIDPNYVPGEAEVIDYAKWLGMDLEEDRDLFWIAREGLMAPLPSDWKPCKTKDTEDIYYFNFSTGESTWDHPCDGYYKRLYEEEKKKKEIIKKNEADEKRVQAKADVEVLTGGANKKRKGRSASPGPGSASDRMSPSPMRGSSSGPSGAPLTMLAPVLDRKPLPLPAMTKLPSPLSTGLPRGESPGPLGGSLLGSSLSSSREGSLLPPTSGGLRPLSAGNGSLLHASSNERSLSSEPIRNPEPSSLSLPSATSMNSNLQMDSKQTSSVSQESKDVTSSSSSAGSGSAEPKERRNFLSEAQQKASSYGYPATPIRGSDNVIADHNVSDWETTARSLEQEVGKLNRELSFSEVSLRRSRDELADLSKRMEDYRVQVNQLREELQESQSKQESTMMKLQAREDDVKRLRQDLESARNTSSRSPSPNAESAEEITRLTKRLSTMRDAALTAEETESRLRREVNDLREDVSIATRQVESLRNRISDEVAQHKREVDRLSEELRVTQKEKHSLLDEVQSLKSSLNDKESVGDDIMLRLREELSAANRLNDTLRKEIDSLNSAAGNLRDELSVTKKQLETQREPSSTNNDQINSLLDDVRRLKEEISEKDTLLGEKDSEIRSLKLNDLSVQEENNRLRRELNEKQAKLDQLQDQTSSVSSKEVESLSKQVDELYAEKSTLVKLIQELEDAQKLSSTYTHELEEERDAFKNRYSTDVPRLEMDVETLQQNLQEVRTSLSESIKREEALVEKHREELQQIESTHSADLATEKRSSAQLRVDLAAVRDELIAKQKEIDLLISATSTANPVVSNAKSESVDEIDDLDVVLPMEDIGSDSSFCSTPDKPNSNDGDSAVLVALRTQLEIETKDRLSLAKQLRSVEEALNEAQQAVINSDERLSRSLSSHEKERQQLFEERTDARSKIAKLQEELTSLQNLNRSLELTLSGVRGELQTSKMSYEHSQSTLQSSESLIEELRETKRKNEEEIRELRDTIRSMTTTPSQSGDNEAKQQEINSLKADLRTVKQELDETMRLRVLAEKLHAASEDTLKQWQKDHADDMKAQEEKQRELEKQLAEAQGELRALAESLNIERSRGDKLVDENKNLLLEVSSSKAKVVTQPIISAVPQDNTDLQQLQEELSEAKLTIERLTRRLAEANQSLVSVNEDLSSTMNRWRETEQRLTSSREALDISDAAKVSLEQRLDQVSQESRSASTKAREIQRKLESEIESLRAQLSSADFGHSSSEVHKKLEAEIASLRNQLSNAQSASSIQLTELQNTVALMTRERDQALSKLSLSKTEVTQNENRPPINLTSPPGIPSNDLELENNTDSPWSPLTNGVDNLDSMSELHSVRPPSKSIFNHEGVLESLVSLSTDMAAAIFLLHRQAISATRPLVMVVNSLTPSGEFAESSEATVRTMWNNASKSISTRIERENAFINRLTSMSQSGKQFISRGRSEISRLKSQWKISSTNSSQRSESVQQRDAINELTVDLNCVIRLVRAIQDAITVRSIALRDIQKDIASSRSRVSSLQPESSKQSAALIIVIAERFSSLQVHLKHMLDEANAVTAPLLSEKDTISAHPLGDVISLPPPPPIATNTAPLPYSTGFVSSVDISGGGNLYRQLPGFAPPIASQQLELEGYLQTQLSQQARTFGVDRGIPPSTFSIDASRRVSQQKESVKQQLSSLQRHQNMCLQEQDKHARWLDGLLKDVNQCLHQTIDPRGTSLK